MKTICKLRLAFLVFAICYLAILVSFIILNLSNMPIQWDEAGHIDNGLFLKLGMYKQFSTNLFYPPLYDFFVFLSYNIFGVSVVSARAVDAVFSVLLLWVVFEFTYKIYDGKTALLAMVFLGAMPGYFYASHFAMLDIMVTFFFVSAIYAFYLWLQNGRDRMLIFIGLTIVVGFLAKYQVIVALLVMFVFLLFFSRMQLKSLYSKRMYITFYPVLLVVAALLIYDLRSYLAMWISVLGLNTAGTFAPAYYLTEMNSIYPTIHPISLLMYILGFAGLAFLAVRRLKADKLLLTWFITVFILYTIISNKNWRYVLPLFPALAISAAALVTFSLSKLLSINRKTLSKIAASGLIAFVCVAMAYSVNDAVYWENSQNINFPLEQAVDYTIAHDGANQGIMILIPNNYFSQGIAEFYLLKDGGTQIGLYSYPWSRIIDPTFNVTVIVDRCVQYDVKFLFLTEYLGNNLAYFDSTVTLMDVFTQLYDTNNFTHVTQQQTFGESPNCIYILNFTG